MDVSTEMNNMTRSKVEKSGCGHADQDSHSNFEFSFRYSIVSMYLLASWDDNDTM